MKIGRVCVKVAGVLYECRPYRDIWFECGKCLQGLVKAKKRDRCPRCNAAVAVVDIHDDIDRLSSVSG